MTEPLTVFTIGYSTHKMEEFLKLLRSNEVTAVVDVRFAPHSRFKPEFGREALRQRLKEAGFSYVFLGRELGGRSRNAQDYKDGRVQYGRLAASDQFQRGLVRVIDGADRHRIVLMCAEKEPLDCHRTLLVGRELERRGVTISHIHADGRIETNSHAMTRLLEMLRMQEFGFFSTRDELIAEACAIQEQRIAFVDQAERARGADGRR